MPGEEIIHIRGEGGSVFALSLPLHESIQDRLTRGHLARVNQDGTPWTEDSTPTMPTQNAVKAEWFGWAVSQGADPEADDPFKLIGKTYRATTAMDAFVYVRPDERHVALIYLEGSDGEDYMIHARNNTDGTVINVMPYRSYSDIKAVWRKMWTPECSPKCPPK